MTTYEKTDVNVLVIKEEVVTTVSMEELLASKKAIERDIAAQDAHYQEMSQIKAAQLTDVNTLIDAAQNLGITVVKQAVEPFVIDSAPIAEPQP